MPRIGRSARRWTLKKTTERGKYSLPDGYYVSYLMSFTDMRHKESAERTVRE